MLNRIATKDELRRRGGRLENDLCVMCGEREETINYLFLGCKIPAKIWHLCDTWVDVNNVHHNQVKTHFKSFHLMELNKKGNTIWRGCG